MEGANRGRSKDTARRLPVQRHRPPETGRATQRQLRSTRPHRVDEEFLGLLHEDFGIPMFSVNRAFMGVPPASMKEAIALCAWATRSARTPDEAGDALRAWARKNQRGSYDSRLVDTPEVTYEDNEHERRVREE